MTLAQEGETSLFDPAAAAPRAHAYWRALEARARAQLESAGPEREGYGRSLFWPLVVYGDLRSRLSSEALTTSLEDEAAAFEGLLATDPERLATWIGRGAPSACVYVEATPALRERCARALALIAHLWPEAQVEATALVRGVAFAHSVRRFSSTSDPKIFGLVHLDVEFYATRSTVEIATAIVHESAHHALFVETARHRLLLEPTRPYYSPFRGEPRPAIGVLHAAMALARMVLWGQRLRASAASVEVVAEIDRIESDLRPKLAATVAELEAVAFTAAGEPWRRDFAAVVREGGA